MFISNIIYNEVSITDANIFNSKSKNPLFILNGSDAGMKRTVQRWYGITRIMALAASLITLVFVAIKMISASTGGDKAKYKILLMDWLKSIILILLLHYFMVIVLNTSDLLVQFFKSNTQFSYNQIINNSFKFGRDDNLIWSASWIVLLVCTFAIVVIYMKRLILICFFIVLGPLVVLMHTIEKLSKGSSGIFKKWANEFIANVAMQPVDALLMSLIIGSIDICANNNQPLIALAFVLGFFPLRTWMLKFLGESSSTNKQKAVTTMLMGAVMGNDMHKQWQKKDKEEEKKKAKEEK